MDNQTTLEEPISLRDTIENAIESTESAVTENTTSQDAVENDKPLALGMSQVNSLKPLKTLQKSLQRHLMTML